VDTYLLVLAPKELSKIATYRLHAIQAKMSTFWVTKPVSHDRGGTAHGVIDNEAAAEEDRKSGVVTLIPQQLFLTMCGTMAA